MGVEKDDHVAILSMNSFNWIAAFYAVIKVGAVAVLINYISRHDDIVKAINFTDCKYLLYGKYIAIEKSEGEFNKLLADTNINIKNTLSIKHSDINPKVFLNNNIEKVDSAYSREEDSKRTSFIIFTTGTTSEPKAVELSQYGILNHIYHNLYRLNEIASDKFMCLLPMFHCFGLLVVNAYLSFYKVVYLNEMSNALGVYKEFIRSKCGDSASIGYIYDKIARVPGFWMHGRSFVKHAIVGGGFTSEREYKFLEKKYGKDKFLNGYGQTECSPLISFVYPDSPKDKMKKTVGKMLDDIEFVIQDPTSKKILPSNETGEILIKGYNICNGYYKIPDESQPFDEDGYLHTGDLGYIDEDQYLVLTGRLKDIIVRKGENISPTEIEKAFEKYKEFTKVRVIGIPSLTEGETIIACVETKMYMSYLKEQQYIKDLHSVLPSLKVPERIICIEKFPLMASGKLDERKLRGKVMYKLSHSVDPKLALTVYKMQKRLRRQ